MEKKPKEILYRNKALYGTLVALSGELLKRKNTAFGYLKDDYASGDKIPRRLWPKKYRKMNPSNLYRIDVGRLHRLIYTLINDESAISIIILDFLDHE